MKNLYKKIAIVSLPLLLSIGCERPNKIKNVETIEGKVIKEQFYNGANDDDTGCNARDPDKYHMIVECIDGNKRLYYFEGSEARTMNTIYDIGSTVKFPKKGRNVKIL